MTVLVQEPFEAGVLGQPVTTAETIFSNVTAGCVYVAGLAGVLACRLAVSGTGGVRDAGFTAPKQVFRFIIDMETMPTAGIEMANCHYFDGAANIKAASITVNATGKLAIRNISTVVATSTTDITAGVWAVEWMVDLATNTQTLRIFNTTSTNATPVETITGAATSPGTDLVQFQAGRYSTSALLWTIDGYKRADDWVASAVAATWDVRFDGTIGANVTTGPNIVAIDAPAPKYAAGGVAVAQIRAHFEAGTVGVGVKAQFPTNPDVSYERFYYEPQNLLDNESFTIWRSESDGGTVCASVLVERVGTGTTVGLQLLDGDGLVIGNLSGIPQLKPFRVEIKLTASLDGFSTTAEVRTFWGANLHGLIDSPTITMIGETPYTGRRNRWLRKGVSAAVRGAYIDEWSARTDDWVGPITDPDEPILPSQWRFWEHHAADPTNPTLLTPSLWVGGAEVPLDIGATSIAGEGDVAGERFAGDPGVGMFRPGWGIEGTYAEHAAEAAAMKSYSVPGGLASNSARAPSFYRVFNSAGISDIIGTHQATLSANSEIRRAMMDGQVVLLTQSHYSQASGNPKMANVASGAEDGFWSTFANRAKDCATRYNAKIILNLGNELDDDGKGYFNKAADLQAYREGTRYLHQFFKDAGVTNVAMTTMTYIQQTWYLSNVWGARVETEGVGVGSRWDAWWHYHPAWKGTRSAQWNRAAVAANGANAWNPDPADFYQPGEDNGFGTGPGLDLMATNAYCWHGKNNAEYRPDLDEWLDWSSVPNGPYNDNVYEGHDFTNRNGTGSIAQHSWRTTQALRNLYGKGNYALVIGELGWGVWEDESQAYPTATANFWRGDFLDSMVDADVVGFAVWKQEHGSADADVRNTSTALHGRFANITAPATLGWKGQPDPTNSRGKGIAGMMDDPRCAPPIAVP